MIMMKRCNCIFMALVALALFACQGRKTASGDGEVGDTLKMKYAQLLTIVRHGEGTNDEGTYDEVMIANPWKAGTLLHRYILVPKGKEGDETVAQLARRRASGVRCVTDTVRTPVESSAVFMAPHCQLMYELGVGNAIRGVCDLDYINIPDIRKRVSSASIVDCGSSMAPDFERIIALKPEAILVSPFENSGGYGKLDKLRIPLIEAADYMETSPLGRAEWMKFYGMLFGSRQADSLFAGIEKEYLSLKSVAGKLPEGLSVLTERKTGGVWYVPGGRSTMALLLKDAHARYVFADDDHSGSLAMSPEQILAKGREIDVWAFKYFGGAPLGKAQLLQEYEGYKALSAFQRGNIYEVDTSRVPYFEMTSFHPELLLREFILLSHPATDARYARNGELRKLGTLRFYQPL